jgi:hypothetical protein
MPAISTREGGMCQVVPDTCKVPAPPAPPVPTPFPNMGFCNQANPATCSKHVKIANQPVLLKQSLIPMSAGDEAGVAGGVVSGQIKGQIAYVQASQKVKIEGQPVVFHTCATAHNGPSANAQGGKQVSPSQAKVTTDM